MRLNRGMLASASKYMGLSQVLESSRFLGSSVLMGASNTMKTGASRYLRGGMRSAARGMARGVGRAGIAMGGIGPAMSARGRMGLAGGAFRGFLGMNSNWSLNANMGWAQRGARMGMLAGGGYMGYRATLGRRRRR